jgi:regulator of sigma E protease
MSTVVTIILAILLFMFLIAFHEFGHFSIAKYLGVNVYEFAVGMGPVIASKEKGGTTYSFRAFPIGGFCDLDGTEVEVMDGEDGEEEIELKRSEDPNDFINQPAWSKILILLAGPIFNIILALIIMTAVLMIASSVKMSFIDALKDSLATVAYYFVIIWRTIAGLFTGKTSASEFSGVVGIVNIMAQEASYGLANLIYFMGALSVNLGVMNLLPIPALDGGRIVITIARKLSGDRLSERAEAIINGAGMVLLLALMAALVVKDVLNLI